MFRRDSVTGFFLATATVQWWLIFSGDSKRLISPQITSTRPNDAVSSSWLDVKCAVLRIRFARSTTQWSGKPCPPSVGVGDRCQVDSLRSQRLGHDQISNRLPSNSFRTHQKSNLFQARRPGGPVVVRSVSGGLTAIIY